jgi:phospholipid transport system substrate-binding protein
MFEMARTPRFSVLIALVVALPLVFALPRGAAAQDPNALISNLGTQAIQVMGPSTPSAQRLARFRELLRDNFDVAGIGQFVLGRYWRTATPQEQQDFLKLFQEYVAQAYSARLSEYAGEPFKVIGNRPNGDEMIVSSQVIRNGSSPIQIDWYVANQGGKSKITDVYVAGVSMRVTQRDEFASVIQHDGGKVEGLLTRLRQKTASQ